jgi:hypothetical protein
MFIRQSGDPQFSSFLDAIVDNHSEDTADLERLPHTQSVQELLDFVFPPAVVADPSLCIPRAILSPFNAFVNAFNPTILRNVTRNSQHYHSSDSIEGDAEGSGIFKLSGGTWNPSARIDPQSGSYMLTDSKLRCLPRLNQKHQSYCPQCVPTLCRGRNYIVRCGRQSGGPSIILMIHDLPSQC